jgi:hypothetical protein
VFSRKRLPFCLLFVFLLCALVGGCGATPGTGAIVTTHTVVIQGKVHGGEQPIVGAQVYLYAAGTTGTGGAGYGANAASLLDAPGYVITGSDGSFTLTGQYNLSSCQSAQDLVYIITAGGDSGGTGNNPGTVLMSALGNCANLNSNTYVVVNEVSTVASVYALQQFMNTAAANYNVGTSSANVTGLQNAFLAVTNLVNSSTGTALAATPNGNGTVPQAEIDSLANIVAACVNSAGGSSVCNSLFSAATPPSGTAPADTLHAILDIAQNPGNDVSALYALESPEMPFVPALTAAPNDWTLAVEYTGGGLGNPLYLAVDASGDIWVPNYAVPNGEAGSLSEFNTLGVSLQGSGGIAPVEGPTGLAIDPSGNLWVVDRAAVNLAKYTSSGSYLSAVTWGCGDFGVGIASDASGNIYGADSGIVCKYSAGGTVSAASWPAIDSFPAVDGAGHVWVTNSPGEDSGIVSIGEFNSSLGLVSGEPSTGWSDYGPEYMQAVAIDAQGNAWAPSALGVATVTELSSSGSVLSGSGYAIAADSSAIAIDGIDTVWTANQNGSLSHVAHGGTPISPSSGYQASGITGEYGIAVDASGNIWTSDVNNYLVEWVGLAAPVATPLVQNLVNNPTTIGQRP